MMLIKLGRCAVIVAVLIAARTQAAVPTEPEWASWPEFCRARFVVAGDGVGSAYDGRVPQSEVARWESQFQRGWITLHHYCYGLLFSSRAASEYDERQRAHILRNAISEFAFTYRSMDPSHAFYGEVAARLAYTYRDIGDGKRAIDVANSVIAKKENYPDGYLLKSILLRKEGKTKEAVSVLEEGIEAMEEESADLHYGLGIGWMDLGDIEKAYYHADRAYSLGYPLPGLRNRLQEAGRPLTDN